MTLTYTTQDKTPKPHANFGGRPSALGLALFFLISGRMLLI